MAASVLKNLVDLVSESELSQKVQKIQAAAPKDALKIAKSLHESEGGKALEADQIHDFITLYALRGVDALRVVTTTRTDLEYLEYWMTDEAKKETDKAGSVEGILYDRSRKYVPRLLGYHAAGMSSRFDPVELACSIALLNRLSPVNESDLTMQAASCIAASQLDDGAWPQGNMVSNADAGHPHLASYEVALTLVHTLTRQVVDRHDLRLCVPLLESLRKSFKLVRANYNIVDKYRGWANDHTRLPRFVESWATAVVLTFLIHYHDLLLEIRQRLILRRYNVTEPPRNIQPTIRYGKSPADVPFWTDMRPAFRKRSSFKSEILNNYWEPVADASMAEAVKSQIINPVERDWLRRPPKRCQAPILWGDPGTGKTLLIERIATVLEWPFVTVSPPDFLRHGGLEGIESAAEAVFHDLLQLRRVVVLFDECEDFFKKRPPIQQVESRTIGAFVTSGMLPRLQHLREKRWTIFALATNSKLEDLDDAVRRPGRFDASIQISHPDLAAQCNFVAKFANEHSGFPSSAVTKALRRYNSRRERARKSDPSQKKYPPVSFLVLDRLLQELLLQELVEPGAASTCDIDTKLSSLLKQPYPPPLQPGLCQSRAGR